MYTLFIQKTLGKITAWIKVYNMCMRCNVVNFTWVNDQDNIHILSTLSLTY